MKYYKLIDDNNIIGVITADDFVKYSPLVDSFTHATDETGEYAVYNSQFYRSSWMQPIQCMAPYKTILITNITEEEYNIYKEALINNQEINNDIEDDTNENQSEPLTPYVDPIDQMSLEFVRDSKLNEMSYACKQTIEDGFDLELHGETCHFSLTIQDQLNLMNLGTMAQTQQLIPYHADGETCEFYTSDEINEIITTATAFKNYQLVYHNALKSYINALETIEDIAAITYGTPIPDEYKTDVLKILEY